jgi:hypothetical protein
MLVRIDSESGPRPWALIVSNSSPGKIQLDSRVGLLSFECYCDYVIQSSLLPNQKMEIEICSSS